MNILKKIYCRCFQGVMKVVLPMMPYREPEVLNGVDKIPELLVSTKIKPLIITDNGIVSLGLTKSLEDSLKANGIEYELFSEVLPNPTSDIIEKAFDLYNSANCQCLIAFGGGSVLDCAKGVGALVSNPKKTLYKMKGLLKVKGPLPLFIAIPTTAGTGSETTVSAVITDANTHEKYVINDFDLIPNYAVLDPELTRGLPKGLTATTGMDTLTHAVEAFVGNATTEKTRKFALESARLVFENLPRVYEDGNNIRARELMLKASYLGGLAFTRSYVGYVHAIAHSLGGKYGLPHGETNAIILPYMLGEYGKSIYKKIREMAIYCNVAQKYDNEEIATSKFINKIIEMNDMFGIPKTIDCIKIDDISGMAKKADREANPLYPVPVLMSAKELEKIYYKIKS